MVHKTYLRLVENVPAQHWHGRAHFFAAAATAMRRILIERARRKHRQIHGGQDHRREIHPDIVPATEPNEDLLALDSALAKLAQRDPVKAQHVELRYFAGLTGEQSAQILGISACTADRHRVYARAWLRREIESGALDHKIEKISDAGDHPSSH